MNSCCRAAACEEVFDARVAAWYLKRYQSRKLDRLERNMLAAVHPAALPGARVLEIGGGVGALQVELLRRGASQGEVIELVAAYQPYAAALAAWAGMAERSSFRVADVLADPTAVLPAAVVVLNRVVCCSSEGVDLVRVAAGLTTGTLLLSYPRASAVARLAARAQQRLAVLFRRKYAFYVRPTAEFRAAAKVAGLEFVAGASGLVWEYAAFKRPAS